MEGLMVKKRLQMILTTDEISRLKISDTEKGNVNITVDVHGMKCSQAKRFINNIINAAHTAFQLVIIHGYNHGTAIKDMLADNFKNAHITTQYQDPFNQGITHMSIA